MNSYNQYLFALASFTLISLTSIAAINYRYDPANIYHAIDKKRNSPLFYAYQLLKSKNGLLRPNNSWNERDIKSALAEINTAADCAVIGSSHSMQISSIGKNASLTSACHSIINLGVSGGTLEDYLALSYKLITNKHKPNTIVFSIDPWALSLNRDIRWQRYKDDYTAMNQILATKTKTQDNINKLKWKYLLNLINPSYLLRSVDQIGLDIEKNIIEEAPIFNYTTGFETPVYLPDGSLVYSKEHNINADYSVIPIGGKHYKIIPGSQFSEQAIDLFTQLINKINSMGINTIILLTPYHHNVWKDKSSITTKALIDVELRIKKFSKDFGITLLGSYNPVNIGCNPDEFYDEMHAKRSCLKKIKSKLLQ